MEINIHHLKSPIKIIETQLGIPQDYKQKCIDEIYRLGDSMNQKTNVKAIMSSYKIWEETIVLNPLIDKIVQSVYHLFPINDSRFFYYLQDCWSIIYKKGHYTDPHSHSPSQISFVYYLKTSPNTSSLFFNECNFEIKPYNDLLILFPSHIVHSVPHQPKNKDRVCISGNLMLKFK